MKYCSHCGNELLDEAVICPKCGCACDNRVTKILNSENVSDKSRGIALILVAFLGVLGIHRFYVGKTGTGILYIFTFGLFGIGTLIDLITIVCGTFKDKNGKLLTNWDFD